MRIITKGVWEHFLNGIQKVGFLKNPHIPWFDDSVSKILSLLEIKQHDCVYVTFEKVITPLLWKILETVKKYFEHQLTMSVLPEGKMEFSILKPHTSEILIATHFFEHFFEAPY